MEHVKMMIDTLFSKLDGMTVKDTVIGKPIVIDDKTILPLFEISVGVAGGGFMGEGEGGGKDEKRGMNGQCKGEGKGGGTGGGLKISPVALLSVDGQGNLGVYSVSSRKAWSEKLSELMPQVIEKIKSQESKQQ
ncbi:MAG TPA: spore germination protein GerW family protein [Dissulfurispiraceae bacterium]|nr:spore germination protein GerW family protein [Dissulfurispiraceae bacterium]